MILVYFKFAVIKQGVSIFWSKLGENQKNVFLYNCLSMLGDHIGVTNLADVLNERQVNMY